MEGFEPPFFFYHVPIYAVGQSLLSEIVVDAAMSGSVKTEPEYSVDRPPFNGTFSIVADPSTFPSVS